MTTTPTDPNPAEQPMDLSMRIAKAVLASPEVFMDDSVRRRSENKIAALIRPFVGEMEAEFMALITNEPMANGNYMHQIHCNGDPRNPIGEGICSCSLGRPLKKLRTELASAQQAKQDALKAGGFCEKHHPDGGTRNCVICAGEALMAALSRISYACEPPNEMGVSIYAVHMDEEGVVQRVQEMAKAKQAALGMVAQMREALAEVMSWISNWTTPFTEDVEWRDTDTNAKQALASAAELLGEAGS